MLYTWLASLGHRQPRKLRASYALRRFGTGLSAHLQKDIGLNDPETFRKRLECGAQMRGVDRSPVSRSAGWFMRKWRRP